MGRTVTNYTGNLAIGTVELAAQLTKIQAQLKSKGAWP